MRKQRKNTKRIEKQTEEKNNNPQKQCKETSCKKSVYVVKKTFSICGFVFLGIILSILIWWCVDKYAFGSPAPSLFGKSGLIVLTGSMSGTIEQGDIVIVEKTEDYKIGDIITFLPKGYTTTTTHRIIGYSEDGGYITKGDANNVKDNEAVYADMIIGEVVDVLPKFGLFFTWLKAEHGWLYLVGCIVVITCGMFVYRYVVGTKHQAETDESQRILTDNQKNNSEKE